MKIRTVVNKLNYFLRHIMLVARIRHYRQIESAYIQNKDALKPIDPEIEKAYIAKWSRLYAGVNLNCLRSSTFFSGQASLHYVPSEIYSAVIERIMNNANYAHYDMNKNNYERFLDQDCLPEAVIRRIRGDYFNREYGEISFEQAGEIFNHLNCDLFVKPAVDTKSGQNVMKLIRQVDGFYSKGVKVDFTEVVKRYQGDFIIQKYLKQYAFLAQFNPTSLNTFRVYTYRSVKDHQPYVLQVIFRMGRNGEIVDNLCHGGIFAVVGHNGGLGEVASDLLGGKYYEHPNTKVKFAGLTVPHYDRIKALAQQVSVKMIHHRLLALDISLDENGLARLVEINILGTGGMHMHIPPNEFQAGLIDEILEYCIKNKDKDDFEHIRI